MYGAHVPIAGILHSDNAHFRHQTLANGGMFSPHMQQPNFDCAQHIEQQMIVQTKYNTVSEGENTDESDTNSDDNCNDDVYSPYSSVHQNMMATIMDLGTHISPTHHNTHSPSSINSLNLTATIDMYAADTTYDEYKQAAVQSSTHHSHRRQLMTDRLSDEYDDESKMNSQQSHHLSVDTSMPHYFQHSAVSMSDQSDAITTLASKQWTCSHCSFLNDIRSTACDLCSSVRPSSLTTDDSEHSESIDLNFEMNVILKSVAEQRQTYVANDSMLYTNNSTAGDKSESDSDGYSSQQVYEAIANAHRTSHLRSSINLNLSHHRRSRKNSKSSSSDGRSLMNYAIGDQVLHNKSDGQSIQGIIVEIRDHSESLYPIRIEYLRANQFGSHTKHHLWVLPQELVKVCYIMCFIFLMFAVYFSGTANYFEINANFISYAKDTNYNVFIYCLFFFYIVFLYYCIIIIRKNKTF